MYIIHMLIITTNNKNIVEESGIFMKKTLYRSTTNRKVAGVCAGIAEYFDIDPTIVRLLFVLFTVFSGTGIPLYIIAGIIMPRDFEVIDCDSEVR